MTAAREGQAASRTGSGLRHAAEGGVDVGVGGGVEVGVGGGVESGVGGSVEAGERRESALRPTGDGGGDNGGVAIWGKWPLGKTNRAV